MVLWLMDLQKSRLEWEMPAGQLGDSCNKSDTDEGQEEMEWSKAERDSKPCHLFCMMGNRGFL